MNERRDDLQEIIGRVLEEMAAEAGDGFDPQACSLALSLVRLAFPRPCISMRGCKLSLDNVRRGR